MKSIRFFLSTIVGVVLTSLLFLAEGPAPDAQAATLPAGFQETTVFSGLNVPTTIEFEPGFGSTPGQTHVLVAEKSGLIKIFSSLGDSSASTFADLRPQVHDYSDRGLLGMAMDPNFAANGFVYVLYTYEGVIGGPILSPADSCSGRRPALQTVDGCPVSARLSRLSTIGTANGYQMSAETVLIHDWCMPYTSHSIGTVIWGPDGALYVGGGEGASFDFADYGQQGNVCADPPAGDNTPEPPSAQGGALRAQDARTNPTGTTNNDPRTLDGTIIRLTRTDINNLAGTSAVEEGQDLVDNIIAYGLRNPFRFNFRPGTEEIWVGDVGWTQWEEIDRIADANGGAIENFGWPCYEGTGRENSYDSANLNVCENLYADPSADTEPVYQYSHSGQSASISGIAFYDGGDYPAGYDGDLFFADYSRGVIWRMGLTAGGLPDPSTKQVFVGGAATPAELEIGPGGDLFYVDIFAPGSIKRIEFFDANEPPTALIEATPTGGDAPLTVQFDGRNSTDPDEGDTLSWEWDLDGDGQYDDSTVGRPTWTYDDAGNFTVRLRVTDSQGATDTDTQVINVSNSAPDASISISVGGQAVSCAPEQAGGPPVCPTSWKVGDQIEYTGTATDEQDGTLPASAFAWSVRQNHCAGTDCHTHPSIHNNDGSKTGQFTGVGHGYPSHLEVILTVTDSSGLDTTETLLLYPKTTTLTMRSEPSGLNLVVGAESGTTPFTTEMILGSTTSISASTPQNLNGTQYTFSHWSDGRAATHNVTVDTTTATFTATYDSATSQLFNPVADSYVSSGSLNKNNGPSPALAADAGPTARNTYLRFNPQGLDGEVTKATLRIYATNPQEAGYQVRPVSDNSWGENTITWANQPAFAASIASSGGIGAIGYVEVDITSLVAGNGPFSIALTTTSETYLGLSSRESGEPPQLIIETNGEEPPPPPPPTYVCLGQEATIVGTQGNDNITGTEGPDVIVGRGGNDILDGAGGDDLICGGDMGDTLRGGTGNDTLNGGVGADKFEGGAGIDTLTFPGAAPVNAEAGQGTASGRGADTLTGIENLIGGSGADYLRGSSGANVLEGGAGDDTLRGTGGNDILRGDDGADYLSGGLGTDSCDGGAGPEKYISDSCETVVGAGSGGGQDPPPPTETYTCLGQTATIAGTTGDDTLTGTAGDDVISGRGGNDTINGLGGDDIICAGDGADTVDGGGGGDIIDGGAGDDILGGGAGSDTVSYGGNAPVIAEAGSGVSSGRGEDTLTSIENLTGGGGDDYLRGSGGANVLDGGGGADTLRGSGGDDTLRGGDGADYLSGGQGADSCDGGPGTETYVSSSCETVTGVP